MRATLRLLAALAGLSWSVGAALASDPAWFRVHGIKAGEVLTVHASASDKSEVVGELPEDTLVQGLGCETHKNVKWCNVQPADAPAVRGWVEHRYLQEAGTPSNQASLGDAIGEPQVGQAECKLKAYPEVASCYYVATQYSGGSATVVLTYAGGQKRVLEYQNKKFHPQVGDESVATEKKGDRFVISVNHGAEVFHVPTIAVLGGND